MDSVSVLDQEERLLQNPLSTKESEEKIDSEAESLDVHGGMDSDSVLEQEQEERLLQNHDPLSMKEEIDSEAEESSKCHRCLPRFLKELKSIDWKKLATMAIASMAIALLCAAISLIASFFPSEALRKGSPPFTIGMIMGLPEVTVAIFSPIVGYYLPLIGSKTAMIIGLVIAGVSYLSLGLCIYVPSGWLFVLCCSLSRLNEGIGTAFSFTVCFALTNELYPKRVGLTMGVLQLFAGVGYAIAPAVGSALFEVGGYMLPMFVMGGACLALAIPSFFLLTESSKVESNKSLLNIKTISKLLKNFITLLLFSSVFTEQCCTAFRLTILELFFKNTFSVTRGEIGLIFTLVASAYLVTSLITGAITDYIFPRILILVGLFATALGFFMTVPSSMYKLFWLSVTGFSITEGSSGFILVAAYPDLVQVTESSLPKSDPKVISAIIAGLITTSMSLGIVVGSLVGGLLLQYLDFAESFAVFGELSLALALLLFGATVIDEAMKRRKKSKKK